MNYGGKKSTKAGLRLMISGIDRGQDCHTIDLPTFLLAFRRPPDVKTSEPSLPRQLAVSTLFPAANRLESPRVGELL
jgi:hypothetical protein